MTHGFRGLIIASAFGAASIVVSGATANHAQGFWSGSGHAVRTANLNLVIVTCTYDSQFWFTVNTDNSIRGTATVRYELNSNDARLRSVLAQGNGIGGAPLGGIPNVGSLLGTGMNTRDAIGMAIRYREGSPQRRGAIAGGVIDGRIHLQWASTPADLPYQDFVIYSLRERPLNAHQHPAYSPWIADADIAEPMPGHVLAITSSASGTKVRGNVSVVAHWSAQAHAGTR